MASSAVTAPAVRIGIIDTGIAGGVSARREFKPQSTVSWPAPSVGNHASHLADIIIGLCPTAQLLDARAFVQGEAGSASQVAAALDWLVEQQVAIANMSFGLRNDRSVLALAITRAADTGMLLLASSPAAGQLVYPAAYPEVLAVTGDARCSVDVYADYAGSNLDFGAAAGGLQHQAHQAGGGASHACAHVSAALARLLDTGCQPQQVVNALRRACHFRGRECR